MIRLSQFFLKTEFIFEVPCVSGSITYSGKRKIYIFYFFKHGNMLSFSSQSSLEHIREVHFIWRAFLLVS